MAPGVSSKVPWVERHRPKHLGEVIGNTDQVRKLAEWLRDWDDVVLRGKVKEQPAPDPRLRFVPAPDNLNARAALVSGPPGIGKTTACCLVARCSPKYSLMEFNASDARGKAIIDSMSQSLAGNHTLRLNSADGKGTIERSVIIMDECDGMSGGDKGGMQAMMGMIKNTKNPIICICNDRSDQGVRNLAAVCYDIKFKRPENAAVAKRIKHVMESEGKRVDLHTIEAVIEACGHDIRHIINQTQFFGSISAHGKQPQKDTQVMLSPFDACARLLSSGSRGGKLPSMETRLDMFYLDADMMPLMIQENYLKSCELRGGGSSVEEDVAQCAKAAELIALGDTMAGHWEVQSSAAILGTLYPAFLSASEAFARPSFPGWLKGRAPAAKAERMVQEMHGKLRAFTTCGCHGLVTSSYHDVLYRRLLKPLLYGAVKECAAALFACGLSREFFSDQAAALRVPLQLEDMYRKVDGKVKYQLLQELQGLAQQAAPVRRKRTGEEGAAAAAQKRRSRGGGEAAEAAEEEAGEAAGGAEQAEGGEEGAAAAGKRRKAAAAKKGGKDPKAGASSSASSLKGWRPKVPECESQVGADGVSIPGTGGSSAKKPLMIMKYLDGHTCAVRRRVRLKDLLDPWTLF